MASLKFIIRCKTDAGTYTITDLDASSTVKALKDELYKVTQIRPDSQRILCGYPPKPLNVHNESTSLWEANIHSGDTLILEALKDAVVPCMPEDEERSPDSVITSVPLVPTTSDMNQLAAFESGIMMRHVVPSNNSCLFASIYYILTNGDENVDKANEFRHVIAKTVQKNTEKYNSGILGMNPHDYCSWIMNPNHWGGGIELAILSEHLKLEICAIDTLSSTMHRFGENEGYDRRIFLIYDGIHYDPLVMELSDNIQGAFLTNDNLAIDLAMEVAREAKSSRQFTDVANFTLKCMTCGQKMRGDYEAREHAKQTKHVDFGEE
ncbi:ubiquitin thioesterase OTU1-like [Uloborus diversus]|uniref:ubiquitin thioesterase OTU1-like n=1 Tax=Uloborus diversus TaxID=327109 RepID=UPI00240A45B3|nr:ubiquitin thioesterase OTU1-like [Uloborus diversus]